MDNSLNLKGEHFIYNSAGERIAAVISIAEYEWLKRLILDLSNALDQQGALNGDAEIANGNADSDASDERLAETDAETGDARASEPRDQADGVEASADSEPEKGEVIRPEDAIKPEEAADLVGSLTEEFTPPNPKPGEASDDAVQAEESPEAVTDADNAVDEAPEADSEEASSTPQTAQEEAVTETASTDDAETEPEEAATEVIDEKAPEQPEPDPEPEPEEPVAEQGDESANDLFEDLTPPPEPEPVNS